MAQKYVVQDTAGHRTVVILNDNENLTDLLKKVPSRITMVMPMESLNGNTNQYNVLMPARKKEGIHCNLLRERIAAVRMLARTN